MASSGDTRPARTGSVGAAGPVVVGSPLVERRDCAAAARGDQGVFLLVGVERRAGVFFGAGLQRGGQRGLLADGAADPLRQIGPRSGGGSSGVGGERVV